MTEDPLFYFQKRAVIWLTKHKTALLALDMGLGKSAVAITAADRMGIGDILVICPAAARINWQREFSKFSNKNREFQILQDRQSASSPIHKSLIVSYDLCAQIPADLTFDALIIDESHMLKSLDAKRTRSIFGKEGIVRRIKRCVWALSGTPAPNHAGELWPLLFTFGATKMCYEKYVDRFCTINPTVRYGPPRITGTKVENIPELKEIMKPYLYRKTKEQVLHQLPKIYYQSLVVEAGPVDLDIDFTDYVTPHDQREMLFKKLEKERDLLRDVLKLTKTGDDGLKAMEALTKSLSTLRRYTGLQKVQAVTDLVAAELITNAYDKIVIFAIHRGVIEALRDTFWRMRMRPVTLYGNTTPEKRQRNIDLFQKDPKTRVFIGNILAAGTAITLTASHQVLFVEQDWVPGNNAQAAMRCHRIGQKRPVFVRFVGLGNSIDERIAFILQKKTKELTMIFDRRKNEEPPREFAPIPQVSDYLDEKLAENERRRREAEELKHKLSELLS